MLTDVTHSALTTEQQSSSIICSLCPICPPHIELTNVLPRMPHPLLPSNLCSPTATHTTGAQGIGLLTASLIGNTLEDILALTVAGLASYVAVLNLPLKRSEIKGKVSKVATNFVQGVSDAMAEVSAGASVKTGEGHALYVSQSTSMTTHLNGVSCTAGALPSTICCLKLGTGIRVFNMISNMTPLNMSLPYLATP